MLFRLATLSSNTAPILENSCTGKCINPYLFALMAIHANIRQKFLMTFLKLPKQNYLNGPGFTIMLG